MYMNRPVVWAMLDFIFGHKVGSFIDYYSMKGTMLEDVDFLNFVSQCCDIDSRQHEQVLQFYRGSSPGLVGEACCPLPDGHAAICRRI